MESKKFYENQLLNIWKSTLGIDSIDINDNFFDIGGTSFSIIKLSQMIKELCKVEISVLDLFQYTTIKDQSTLIFSKKSENG
jgi:acyl carrier protein